MTYMSFIEICKEYAREHNKFLHPNNVEAQKPLYKMFKGYCYAKGLSEDEEESIFEWLDSEVNNPDVMIDKLDTTSNERIVIFGTLKDKICLQTEIKRGNEKQIVSEVKLQITQILNYAPFYHEGGNHIIFKDTKTGEIFYCIEWHYAKEPKENLIKKTCKELGLTYRELGEKIGYSESAINNASRQDKISEPLTFAINLYLENLKLKEELEDFRILKKILTKRL
ncbi:helix-turn-helix domain-containing protein [Helicobacter sp.]|uniref:helix-turn-helix domain-containing protein n=1 Tax=Helicobacter sp. TaxID=218 RepID=UPI00345C2589